MSGQNGSSKGALRAWTIGLCVLGVFVLVVTQISYADKATKLNIALFNALQLILSLAFAWLLSNSVSESHFQETQKRFAMAAFRRIKEIERSILRLQQLVNPGNTDSSAQIRESLSMVRVGLEGAQDNVRSSIADWSDVIGSEIEVANEVSRLKSLREGLEEKESRVSRRGTTDRLSKQFEELDKKIESLTERLPAEMAVALEGDESFDMGPFLDALTTEWNNAGMLEFEAYWESEDSFSSDPSTIGVGDRVLIGRGITEDRSEVILVYDEQHRSVAVLLNKLLDSIGGHGYEGFVVIMRKFFGKSLLLENDSGLQGIVTRVGERKTSEGTKSQHLWLEIRNTGSVREHGEQN